MWVAAVFSIAGDVWLALRLRQVFRVWGFGMSIKAYVGIMGSANLRVVTVVIYNALKRGRRVASNIAGLNFGR